MPNHADTPIRLVDLPARLPRRADGARVDFSTVWGWVTTGPETDRLATILIGDIPHTTDAAVAEFLARHQSAADQVDAMEAELAADQTAKGATI